MVHFGGATEIGITLKINEIKRIIDILTPMMFWLVMKRTIIISLFICSFELVHAQFAENNAIYFSQELNFGNYIGLNADLNYVYKERFSFKIGYNGNIRKPKSQPEDYSSGLVKGILLGLGQWLDY
jgi:hypothetical protein